MSNCSFCSRFVYAFFELECQHVACEECYPQLLTLDEGCILCEPVENVQTNHSKKQKPQTKSKSSAGLPSSQISSTTVSQVAPSSKQQYADKLKSGPLSFDPQAVIYDIEPNHITQVFQYITGGGFKVPFPVRKQKERVYQDIVSDCSHSIRSSFCINYIDHTLLPSPPVSSFSQPRTLKLSVSSSSSSVNNQAKQHSQQEGQAQTSQSKKRRLRKQRGQKKFNPELRSKVTNQLYQLQHQFNALNVDEQDDGDDDNNQYLDEEVSEEEDDDTSNIWHHSKVVSQPSLSKIIPPTKIKASNSCIIVWFRWDLRTADNTALYEASLTGLPIIPIFIWSPEDEGKWVTGGCARYWLHESLQSLSNKLRLNYDKSFKFIYRKGPACQVMPQLIDQLYQAKIYPRAIYCNHVYEPWLLKRDNELNQLLMDRYKVPMVGFCSNMMFEPWDVRPDTDEAIKGGFGSVRWYLNGCKGLGSVPNALPAPDKLQAVVNLPSTIYSTTLQDIGIHKLPIRKSGEVRDWTQGIKALWEFGEPGAQKALVQFVEDGIHHFEQRDRFRADRRWTARISPYMRFGELGPRQVFDAVKRVKLFGKAKTFLRRFAWRDLAYWMTWKFPYMVNRSLRPQYDHQRWEYNKPNIIAWQRGQTGYPLVDAAMRQLWVEGWMCNYLRHVAAGFLIEYLNEDWRVGLDWFHETLVDSDIAINANMWQNGGHSGVDQWNFVMHPVNAAKSCDPDGAYTRKWVPEVAALPTEYIHCPWLAPMTIKAKIGFRLGESYPHPIVTDLQRARRNSMAAVHEVRLGVGAKYVLADGNEGLRLPDGRYARLITRVDYREFAKDPITFQSTEANWEEKKDPGYQHPLKEVLRLHVDTYRRNAMASMPDADEEDL